MLILRLLVLVRMKATWMEEYMPVICGMTLNLVHG